MYLWFTYFIGRGTKRDRGMGRRKGDKYIYLSKMVLASKFQLLRKWWWILPGKGSYLATGSAWIRHKLPLDSIGCLGYMSCYTNWNKQFCEVLTSTPLPVSVSWFHASCLHHAFTLRMNPQQQREREYSIHKFTTQVVTKVRCESNEC